MKRRPVLAGLGAAALSSAAARAQTKVRRVGILMGNRASGSDAGAYIAAFKQGLAERGWKDGVDVVVDWRWAGANPELFERYATELLSLQPDALLAQSSPAVRALSRRTGTVPIVFTIITDPVGQGFTKSLAHPGGNVTGFTDFEAAMAGKWIDLLTQLRPPVRRVAILYNPETAPFADYMLHAVKDAAPAFAVATEAAPCRDDAAIEALMSRLAQGGQGGVVALPDIFNIVHRDAIVAAAAEYRVPVIYFIQSFAKAGGLMSYGVDYADQFRRAADYIDRVLKGARAGDLPVQQPDKFSFVINLKTAKTLGVEVPATLLASANEVIE